MGNLPVPRDVSTSFTVVSNLLEQAYNMEDQWNEKWKFTTSIYKKNK